MSKPKAKPSKVVWSGPDKLRPLLVPLAQLKADPDNARTHNERNRSTIRMSLEKNGQVQVLVSYKGVVFAGNARMEEMKGMGWTHGAVLDTSDYFSSLKQAKAFSLIDNKAGELAEWDYEKVAKELKRLRDEWPSSGFADFEIEPLTAAEWKPPAPDPNADTGAGAGTEGKRDHPRTVGFSPEQWEVVSEAIARVRKGNDGPEDATDGRCLELICADYLAGA